MLRMFRITRGPDGYLFDDVAQRPELRFEREAECLTISMAYSTGHA
jgi:hypothetical protein